MAETLCERRRLGNRDSDYHYPGSCWLDGLQTEEITVIRKEVPDVQSTALSVEVQRLTSSFSIMTFPRLASRGFLYLIVEKKLSFCLQIVEI